MAASSSTPCDCELATDSSFRGSALGSEFDDFDGDDGDGDDGNDLFQQQLMVVYDNEQDFAKLALGSMPSQLAQLYNCPLSERSSFYAFAAPPAAPPAAASSSSDPLPPPSPPRPPRDWSIPGVMKLYNVLKQRLDAKDEEIAELRSDLSEAFTQIKALKSRMDASEDREHRKNRSNSRLNGTAASPSQNSHVSGAHPMRRVPSFSGASGSPTPAPALAPAPAPATMPGHVEFGADAREETGWSDTIAKAIRRCDSNLALSAADVINDDHVKLLDAYLELLHKELPPPDAAGGLQLWTKEAAHKNYPPLPKLQSTLCETGECANEKCVHCGQTGVLITCTWCGKGCHQMCSDPTTQMYGGEHAFYCNHESCKGSFIVNKCLECKPPLPSPKTFHCCLCYTDVSVDFKQVYEGECAGTHSDAFCSNCMHKWISLRHPDYEDHVPCPICRGKITRISYPMSNESDPVSRFASANDFREELAGGVVREGRSMNMPQLLAVARRSQRERMNLERVEQEERERKKQDFLELVKQDVFQDDLESYWRARCDAFGTEEEFEEGVAEEMYTMDRRHVGAGERRPPRDRSSSASSDSKKRKRGKQKMAVAVGRAVAREEAAGTKPDAKAKLIAEYNGNLSPAHQICPPEGVCSSSSDSEDEKPTEEFDADIAYLESM